MGEIAQRSPVGPCAHAPVHRRDDGRATKRAYNSKQIVKFQILVKVNYNNDYCLHGIKFEFSEILFNQIFVVISVIREVIFPILGAMNYSSQIQSILYCPPSYVNVTMINCSWILIQQNFLQNSATAFYRSWIEYKNGFSDTYGNLWFGNEKLSLLTLNWKWRLRVEVQSYGTNKWYFAEYESITVLNETNKYQLEVFNYSGNAHDGLGGYSDSSHWSANGSKFSTYDSDNTAISGGRNCPINNKGGWWYKLCGGAVLNGNGMNGWAFFKSDFGAATNQMAGSRMMIQLI